VKGKAIVIPVAKNDFLNKTGKIYAGRLFKDKKNSKGLDFWGEIRKFQKWKTKVPNKIVGIT
jgi:hypothetical protein